jgi:hypothetical protein
LAEHGESWSEMQSCTLKMRELDREFSPTDCDVKSFVLRTAKRVYFDAFNRGAGRLVDSLARNPPVQKTTSRPA